MILLLGIVTAINVIVIIAKYRIGRVTDAMLDASIFIGLSMVFSTGYNTMAIGTITSLGVTIYLWFKPILSKKDKRRIKAST